MSRHDVFRFRPHPLEVGQKIHIDGGRLGGDWEVVAVDDRKVRLRCPISGRELERDPFIAFVAFDKQVEWPRHDE